MDGIKKQCAMLLLCMTVKEVAAAWGKSRKSVEMRVLKGSFVARKTTSGWLISAPSVQDIWGPPVVPLGRSELEDIYGVKLD